MWRIIGALIHYAGLVMLVSALTTDGNQWVLAIGGGICWFLGMDIHKDAA